MSAEIWINLQKAVSEIRPDLASKFNECRDKASIVEFLNRHFPLEGHITPPGWENHLMAKAPDMLRGFKGFKR